MDILALKARLKSESVAGWYIFSGEEDYLKKYYLGELRRIAVDDGPFAPFNHSVYDGEDFDLSAIEEDIKSPPMMGEYKLIEWKFANLDGLKESQKSALQAMCELKEDYPSAIFAIMTTADGFDIGTPKRPSKLAGRLSRGFEILSFPKSGDSQLLGWLKKHFDAEGISVDLASLNALLFRSGRSMDVLNNEVEKLAAYIKMNGRSSLTAADVEEIASPTVECDAFALSNAVIEKSSERAFVALTDLKQRRIEPQAVLAMLERTYADLVSVALLLEEGKGASDVEAILKFHPYKAKLYVAAAKKIGRRRLAEGLSELCRLDAASKSGGSSGYGTIETFVAKHL